jgi:pimeloyl-ACP methyl ester carboxylesterase
MPDMMLRSLLISAVLAMALLAGACGRLISYAVRPSKTDATAQGVDRPCGTKGAIGCRAPYGPDQRHVLYLNAAHRNEGRLLVFFPGGGSATGWGEEKCTGHPCAFYEAAAKQGYHVIGLSYFNETKDKDHKQVGEYCQDELDCYGPFMREVLYGTPCDEAHCGTLDIDEHPQDSIVARLEHVLKWAADHHPQDGWDRYLTKQGRVKWKLVSLAGFSLGTGYAAMLGLDHADDIGRVVLLAGPNDGHGPKGDRNVATWIQPAGPNAFKFYGLVHYKNHMDGELEPSKLYRVTAGWDALGLEGPVDFELKDVTGPSSLNGAHKLVSMDPKTTAEESHTSVLRDRYDASHCQPTPNPHACDIGYRRVVWPYILGSGI